MKISNAFLILLVGLTPCLLRAQYIGSNRPLTAAQAAAMDAAKTDTTRFKADSTARTAQINELSGRLDAGDALVQRDSLRLDSLAAAGAAMDNALLSGADSLSRASAAADSALTAKHKADSLLFQQTFVDTAEVKARPDSSKFKSGFIKHFTGTRLDSITVGALGGGIWYEDYWPDSLVSLGAGQNHNFASDQNFPDVVVPALPEGATIRAAYVLMRGSFYTASDYFDQENGLSGYQQIRVKSAAGTWDVNDVDGILFGTGSIGMMTYGTGNHSTGEMQLVGGLDVKSVVSGPGTYNLQWEDARCLAYYLVVYADAGLRVVYQR